VLGVLLLQVPDAVGPVAALELGGAAAAAETDGAQRHGHEAAERIVDLLAFHGVLDDRAVDDVELQRAEVHLAALGGLHGVERAHASHVGPYVFVIALQLEQLERRREHLRGLQRLSDAGRRARGRRPEWPCRPRKSLKTWSGARPLRSSGMSRRSPLERMKPWASNCQRARE
jgi:hypothetical protein